MTVRFFWCILFLYNHEARCDIFIAAMVRLCRLKSLLSTWNIHEGFCFLVYLHVACGNLFYILHSSGASWQCLPQLQAFFWFDFIIDWLIHCAWKSLQKSERSFLKEQPKVTEHFCKWDPSMEHMQESIYFKVHLFMRSLSPETMREERPCVPWVAWHVWEFSITSQWSEQEMEESMKSNMNFKTAHIEMTLHDKNKLGRFDGKNPLTLGELI